MRKAINMALMLLLIAGQGLLVSCSNRGNGSGRQGQETQQTTKEAPRRNPVYSLFTNTGKEGYMLYRNSDRIGLFALEEGRRVLGMKCHAGESYILISELMTDSINEPVEIYKNGRPVMSFEKGFQGLSMDMYGGHFYVMGHYGDSATTIFRDGVKIYNGGYSRASRPVLFGVRGQDIYIAQQTESHVDIYKNGQMIKSFDGQLRDFKVSHMGYYTITDKSLYRDSEHQQTDEYYRLADKEMLAKPDYVSITDDNCYVGCQSHILNDDKLFACVFLNRQSFMTVKPDDKPIGTSPLQTRCVGVAASREDAYTVVLRCDENYEPILPVTFQYYYNHDQCFDIDFSTSDAKLLFVESCK